MWKEDSGGDRLGPAVWWMSVETGEVSVTTPSWFTSHTGNPTSLSLQPGTLEANTVLGTRDPSF